MASSWIVTRPTKNGGRRFRVEYRLGGRESATRYGGSFKTKREALGRKQWLDGELAARRLPDFSSLETHAARTPTIADAAERWQASRLDASANTKLQHRSAVRAMLPLIGTRRVDSLSPADVAELVAKLSETRKRETVRKTLLALAMVLDFAGVTPNPARDRTHVRLPRGDSPEIVPPTADQVLAVHGLLPTRYRLPLLVLDATAMRLGELEQLRWGDVDERRGRWRVTSAVSKTKQARWVTVPPVLFEAVCALVARDDRTPERRVFQGFGGDRFRTAVTRACTAAGVPAFSPHDLRHRRISLLHLAGVPWARIGEAVGQRSLRVTSDTYTHVLVDETELNYTGLLADGENG
jgi:integrase